MKTLKKTLLLVLIATVFITCKKETLPPSTVVNSPVFAFTGTINGNNLNWQAGINNYYMYSSYSQNSSTGVYSFIGTLQPVSTNKNSIQIIINDYKASTLNASVKNHIDTSLSATASYAYNKGPLTYIDTTGYSITLTPHIQSGTATSFNYAWGDLSSNTVIATATPVTHKYATLGNYNTSLQVHFSSCGTTDTVANSLNVGSLNPLIVNSVTPMSGAIGHDTVNYTLTANATGGVLPYTYAWKFGNGDTSNVNPGASRFDTGTNTTYSNLVIVTDNIGNTASYRYVLHANRTAPACLFSYSMSKPTLDTTKISNAAELSDVTIIYTDGGGNVYTSNNISQSNTSKFQILSVAPYQDNTNSQYTKMLKVTFSCSLYPVSGLPISANGTAIVAVAYQ